MRIRAFIAEFIGTFSLTITVVISLSSPSFPVTTPVLAALCVALFVYTIGPISGAHLNPAVTVGAVAIGKIDLSHAVPYIMMQFAGAWVALMLGIELVGPPVLDLTRESMPVGLAEVFGTFFLGFGIAMVMLGGVSSALSGVVVGGSLLLGISISAPVSNGVLNPAVALGICSGSAPYIWGPLVGGILGMVMAKVLHPEVEESNA